MGVGNMKGREEKPHAAMGSSYSAELTAGWEDAASAFEFFSPLFSFRPQVGLEDRDKPKPVTATKGRVVR